MLVQFHNRWRGIMPGIHEMGLGVALEHIKAGRASEVKEEEPSALDTQSKHPPKRRRKKPAGKGGNVNKSNSGSGS